MSFYKNNRFFFASYVLMVLAVLLSQTSARLIAVIITLPLVILVPGLVVYAHIVRELKFNNKTILLSVGLGVLFIILETLLLNFLFPIFRPHSLPLTSENIIITHLVLTLFVILLLSIRSKTIELHFPTLKISKLLINSSLIILPLMAMGGAVHLNNMGSGTLAVTTTCLVAIAAILQITIKPFSYGWLLYILGFTMLLSTSMRSSYITGFDISQEFQVFQNTLLHRQWFISHGDPYNSCLSLNLLPVALHELTKISPEFIYKFVYQSLFALVPVIIYVTLRAFRNAKWSFLAAFFFISQTQFILTMPAITRQEIALLYFSLMMMLLLTTKLKKYDSLLFIIFGFGMIVSHYSTTYVALLMLLLFYIFNKVANVVDTWRKQKTNKNEYTNITFRILFILIIGSLFWYSQVNFSSTNLDDVASKSFKNIGSAFSQSAHSQSVQNSVFSSSSVDSEKILNAYLGEEKVQDKVGVQPYATPVIKVTNPTIATVVSYLRSALLAFTKIALIFGTLYLSIKYYRHQKLRPLGMLSMAALVIIFLVIAAPNLSLSYNLERVYQQALVVLSFAIIIITPESLPIISIGKKYVIAACVVIMYFLLSPGSGVVNQFTGGTTARINYSNTGDYYQTFYVHKSDVIAAKWAGSKCNLSPIFSDSYMGLVVVANTRVPANKVNQTILNAQLSHCVLLGYTNNQAGAAYATYNGKTLAHTLSKDYYKDYNQIYTNSRGTDTIYSRIR